MLCSFASEASDTARMIEHPVPVYTLIRSLLAEPLSEEPGETPHWRAAWVSELGWLAYASWSFVLG